LKRCSVLLRMREKWVCRGGVLTHISMHWPRCVITTARQLPSVLRGIEEREWTLDVGLFWILTFGIDPSQDLFLAIEPVLALCVLSLHLCYTTLLNLDNLVPSSPNCCRAHPLLLSSGEPHPLASEINHERILLVGTFYKIQILGSLIGGQDSNDKHLTILDWKTGAIRLVCMHFSHDFFDKVLFFTQDLWRHFEACSFLSEDLVVVGFLSGDGLGLDIYDLRLTAGLHASPPRLECAVRRPWHEVCTSTRQTH
jgi:hypothetical protein